MNRQSLVFGVAVAGLFVFIAASYFFAATTPEAPKQITMESTNLERPYSPSFGPDDAPVTIVEFFDPACEACRSFHPIVKEIMNLFPGKTRLVLRYAAFHEPSAEAIALLEAARLQDKFEPVLERLFDTQRLWAPHGKTPVDVWGLLEDTGLNIEQARQVAKMPEIKAVLSQDAADIEAVGVTKTPTFFVNGKMLMQFDPRALFGLVEAEVQAAAGK